MKKLFITMIAMASLICFASDMAMAQPRLSIKGEFRVRGFSTDGFTFDNDDPSKKREWLEQRLRVQPIIKLDDGVTINARFDFSEHIWGGSNYNESTGKVRPAAGTNDQFQVDRAYVDINKTKIRMRAGQQFLGLGQNQVLRDNKAGIQVDIKTKPVDFRIGYIKADENFGGDNNYSDEDTLGTEDVNRYFIDIGYATDPFSIAAFYAMQDDNTAAANEPSVLGAYVKTRMGSLSLKGELAAFGGDTAAGIDYVGNQLNISANYKLSDKVELAADFVYSDGTDDTTEDKISYIGTPFGRKGIVTGGSMFEDVYETAFPSQSGLSGSTVLGPKDVFDPFNGNTGAIGGAIGSRIMPMDALNLMGWVYFLSAEEDIVGEFEECIVYNFAAEYQLTANSLLRFIYTGVDASFKDIEDPDMANALALFLKVKY